MSSTRRGYLKIVAGAAAGLAAGGAAGYLLKPTPTTEQVEKKYAFTFAGWSPGSDPWATALAAGINNIRKILPDCTISYIYPEPETMEQYVTTIDTALNSGIDGIFIGVWYPEATKPMYTKAKQLGIPVVSYNIPCPDDWNPGASGDPRNLDQGFVGVRIPDCTAALINRALADFTPGHSVYCTHGAGRAWDSVQYGGMSAAMEAAGLPKPDYLEIGGPEGSDTTQAYEDMRAYIQANPTTDLLLTVGPLGAHPAIQLVKDLGKKGVIRIADDGGMDDVLMTAIHDEYVICGVDQQTFFQAFIPPMWLYCMLEFGFFPPRFTQTGPAVIDKNNLESIRLQVEKAGYLPPEWE
jgi:simple sugar transport system substrate-binding protein